MPEPKELVLLTEAIRALTQATTIDEVKELRDKATAVKAYAQKAQLGQQLVIDAAVVRLRAERRLGEILAAIQLANAAPGNQYTQNQSTQPSQAPLLKDLGINKKDSSRSQRIAAIHDEVFERYLAASVSAQRQPTTAGLLRLQKLGLRDERSDGTTGRRHVQPSLLADLVATETRFATVYAAPPWPLMTSQQKEAIFSVAGLLAEPVSMVSEDDSQLHITANIENLPHAMQLLRGWGFQYRSCLVCISSEMTDGEFWQPAHQFLLLGTRGRPSFSNTDHPSWIECEWTPGGQPEEIHALIESVSPPPYLQLFTKEPPPSVSWTHRPLTIQHNQVQP